MYILTKKDNVIMHMSEDLARQEGTNYYLINNGTLAVPTNLVENEYEVQEVLEEVEVEKYCFNDTEGFYENENYVEPKTDKQTIEELQNKITELQQQMQEKDEQLLNVELAIAEIVEGGI